MIDRTFTNQYLEGFDSLSESIYLCWHNCYDKTTKRINDEKLSEQIRLYGLYPFKKKDTKELPLCFQSKRKLKTLTWVNRFTDDIADKTYCDSTELHLLSINEIKQSLFTLKDKTERVAYGNIILNDLDRSHICNNPIERIIFNRNLKKLLFSILNQKLTTQHNNRNETNEYNNQFISNLTIQTIIHLYFIDKLIELFLCFDICLLTLAEKINCNLYTFHTINCTFENQKIISTEPLPKFNSQLSDDCLIKIMHYLINKKILVSTNTDVWLYWFNRKYIKVPEPLKWRGSPTMLSNIIQHLCGESIATTMKAAFCRINYIKPTRKVYEISKTYKEIEQIITISKQKNN